MGARRGIFIPPFDELAEPRVQVDLARRAEARGWDGYFLWDHVAYTQDPTVGAIADPWIVLAAIAVATERLRIGPMVTPLSRRRVQKVARETATLDRLSEGRLTFGVGLGVESNGELEPFGEVIPPRERAALLDGGLDRLASFWAGEFEPRPVQSPRVPVWVAGRWKSRRRPLERAARWDGFFPIGLPEPAALEGDRRRHRRAPRRREGRLRPRRDDRARRRPAPWEAAGATWVLTSFRPHAQLAEVEGRIDSGPGV